MFLRQVVVGEKLLSLLAAIPGKKWRRSWTAQLVDLQPWLCCYPAVWRLIKQMLVNAALLGLYFCSLLSLFCMQQTPNATFSEISFNWHYTGRTLSNSPECCSRSRGLYVQLCFSTVLPMELGWGYSSRMVLVLVALGGEKEKLGGSNLYGISKTRLEFWGAKLG